MPTARKIQNSTGVPLSSGGCASPAPSAAHGDIQKRLTRATLAILRSTLLASGMLQDRLNPLSAQTDPLLRDRALQILARVEERSLEHALFDGVRGLAP